MCLTALHCTARQLDSDSFVYSLPPCCRVLVIINTKLTCLACGSYITDIWNCVLWTCKLVSIFTVAIRHASYLWELLLDEFPFLLCSNSGIYCASCMQTDIDGCLTHSSTTCMYQHWITLLHTPIYHQCIINLSVTKHSICFQMVWCCAQLEDALTFGK